MPLPISNFLPIRSLDPDCCYKFTYMYLMANSADPGQLASSEANCLDLHRLQRQRISRFSRTRVRMPLPLLIFSQSDHLILIDAINSHT